MPFAHPLLIALVAFLTWQHIPHDLALGWGLAVVLATAFRAGWLRTVTRRTLSDRDLWQGVRLTVVLLGLTWGVGAAIALQDLPASDVVLVFIILAGIIAAALTTLSADQISFLGMTAAVTVPVLVGIVASGQDRVHAGMAAVLAVFAGAMALVSRRAHAEIIEYLRTTILLRDARDLAERAARTRSAFLANMSHEIRTPMNAVLGFVELILDTNLSVEQRRALELVRSSSETLVTILNDILDYSKIEAEHLQLEAIPFDLPKLVYATSTLLAVRAREKHLELLAEVPPDVPRTVRGDPTRLRQVLTNLIGNAIKFTEEGEVVVSVAPAGGRDAFVALRFAVRDTGIGIAPEQLRAIFSEFTQADASTTRRYGGTGLGLSISQKLVRLMGGELTVTSESGRGSTFQFTLTLPVEAAAGRIASTRATLGGRRALIVNDNPTNRRVFRDMLGTEGLAVDEAGTAAEGLEAMRRAVARNAPFDVAILDAEMADQDGFDFAAAVRAEPALAATRLLLLTAAGQRGDAEWCRSLGINAYLTKPVSRLDLVDALGAVLLEADQPSADATLITRHTIAESRRSKHILLAEDTVVNQEVAVATLVKRGHFVDVVSNGREAVEALTRRTYDIVLMDLQMPEMDGLEATRAIRALPGGRDIPIIALTAHALSGQREHCLAHGMTGFLTKPFKGHELFAVVEGGPDRATTPIAALPEPQPVGPDPVDLEGLRAALREVGAEAAATSVLDSFVAEAPERLAALATATETGDPGGIARAAHAFLGVAATIRAYQLATLLKEVEAAAKGGDALHGRAALGPVRDAATAAVEFVRAHRGAHTAGAPR